MLGVLLVIIRAVVVCQHWIWEVEPCKKFIQIEKLQSRELNVHAWQTSFSVIFLLDKIKVPKFINILHLKQDPRPLHQQRS